MKKKRIAIYVRNDNAVTGQLKRITNMIGNNRMNTLTIYNDIDASGTSRDRVELNRLLEDIKNQAVDIIYIDNLHILSRDIEHAFQIYDLILLKNIQLISIKNSSYDMHCHYFTNKIFLN
jgi:DNA invertase Pin-like site-specific DNA recombinase